MELRPVNSKMTHSTVAFYSKKEIKFSLSPFLVTSTIIDCYNSIPVVYQLSMVVYDKFINRAVRSLEISVSFTTMDKLYCHKK